MSSPTFQDLLKSAVIIQNILKQPTLLKLPILCPYSLEKQVFFPQFPLLFMDIYYYKYEDISGS